MSASPLLCWLFWWLPPVTDAVLVLLVLPTGAEAGPLLLAPSLCAVRVLPLLLLLQEWLGAGKDAGGARLPGCWLFGFACATAAGGFLPLLAMQLPLPLLACLLPTLTLLID